MWLESCLWAVLRKKYVLCGLASHIAHTSSSTMLYCSTNYIPVLPGRFMCYVAWHAHGSRGRSMCYVAWDGPSHIAHTSSTTHHMIDSYLWKIYVLCGLPSHIAHKSSTSSCQSSPVESWRRIMCYMARGVDECRGRFTCCVAWYNPSHVAHNSPSRSLVEEEVCAMWLGPSQAT